MAPDEIIERFVAKLSPFKILLAMLFLVMAAVEFSNGQLEIYDFLIPALSCLLINELYLQGTDQYEAYVSNQKYDRRLRIYMNVVIGVLIFGSTLLYALNWDATNFFRVGAVFWGVSLLVVTRKRYTKLSSFMKLVYLQLGSCAIIFSLIDLI